MPKRKGGPRAAITVERVLRPQPIGPEQWWLRLSHRGRHLGWLPDGTPQRAVTAAGRRWVGEDAAIAAEARALEPLMGGGRALVARYAEGLA